MPKKEKKEKKKIADLFQKIKSINEKIKEKKNKKNRSPSFTMWGILIFFITGYVFFLFSPALFNHSKAQPSPIGETIVKDGRSVTVERWAYSAKQDKFEIELEILNESLDGNNTYAFELVDKSGNRYKLEYVIVRVNYFVVHAKNIPKNFKDMSLRIKGDYENSQTFKFYATVNSVETTDDITVKTLDEYYAARIERSVEKLKDEILSIQNEIQSLEKKSEELYNTNILLEKEKKYQTEHQKENIDAQIKRNEEIILNNSDKISVYKETIIEINLKISEYQEQAEKIKSK